MNKYTFKNIKITELHQAPPTPVENTCLFYVTLNAEISLASQESKLLQSLFALARTRVSVDGQWILWALKRKYPNAAIKKLSGSELIYQLSRHSAVVGKRLMLLGSSPAHNGSAVERLRQRNPGLEIQGFSPDYFDPKVDNSNSRLQFQNIREAIEKFRPHYIITGFGVPKEQTWAMHEQTWLDAQKVECVFFFGGSIDFASGHIKRAPPVWQKTGLEGLYRIIQQPTRLRRFFKVLTILPDLILKKY